VAIRRAIVPLIMTASLSAGTFYAVHEVGELNLEADRVQACLDTPGTAAPYCYEHVMTGQEVQTLRGTADKVGMLGWVAFGSAIVCGFKTLRGNEEDQFINLIADTVSTSSD
jgi:hypothetical protein